MAEHDSGGGPGWETPAGGAPSGNAPPDGTPAPAPLRTGPPWEREGGFFDRFFETVRGVLLSPTFFFDRMRREGGLGPPLGYAVIGIVAGSIVSLAYRMLLVHVPLWTGGFGVGGDVGFLIAFITTIILAPIVAVLVLFIASAIFHVLLLLFGGAGFPFETTFRVAAYSFGSTAFFAVIPFCGGLLGAVWNIVVLIIGLARAHETSEGKAAAAVLVPVGLCCLFLLLVFVIFGIAVLAAIAGLSQELHR